MTIGGFSMSTPSLSLALPPRAATVSSPSSSGHDENNVPALSLPRNSWHSSTSPVSSSSPLSTSEKTKQRKLSDTSGTTTSLSSVTPAQIPRSQQQQQNQHLSHPQQQGQKDKQQKAQQLEQQLQQQQEGLVNQRHEPAITPITNLNSGSNSSKGKLSQVEKSSTSSNWAHTSPASSSLSLLKPSSPALPPRVLGTSNSFKGNGNGNSNTYSKKSSSGANSSHRMQSGPMREHVAAVSAPLSDQRHALAPRSTANEPNGAVTSTSHTPSASTGTPPRKARTSIASNIASAPQAPAINSNSGSPLPSKGKGVTSVSPVRGGSASNGHTNTTGTSLTSSPSVRASLLPKNPRDVPSSPNLRARTSISSSFKDSTGGSPATAPGPPISLPSPYSASLPPPPVDWPGQANNRHDPDDQEQALFEQRLCEDALGVAVRKINQNGKSNLRYVRCIYVNTSELEMDLANGSVMGTSSTRSVSSRSKGAFSRLLSDRGEKQPHSVGGNPYYNAIDSSEPVLYTGNMSSERKTWVLTWGKKKDVRIPLERFTCVKKGKLTERTRRNLSPPSRILSLITDDPRHSSLDIEAPTRLDRDKFAKAFARFLNIPLEGDDVQTVRSADVTTMARDARLDSHNIAGLSASHSVPDIKVAQRPKPTKESKSSRNISTTAPLPQITTAPSTDINMRQMQDKTAGKQKTEDMRKMTKEEGNQETPAQSSNPIIPTLNPPEQSNLPRRSKTSSKPAASSKKNRKREQRDSAEDDESDVSSLTGAGFDQEIVEELHHALNELRAELEESRAEAARAVKVAEQAIQSAENSSSKDWNSTVTHKAAEAAALAQKRSAEAMAKQRLAEERLESEKRNAAYWRKQAEVAEEEAGALQTRAASAEVQRAAIAESLESERRKASQLVSQLRQQMENQEAAPVPKVDPVMRIAASENLVRQKVALINRTKTLGSPTSRSRSEFQNEILRVQEEYMNVRNQFELLRLSANESLATLPSDVQMWAESASKAISAAQSETDRLWTKLARESATRRKLLHEVQDLRGAIRVYCRPRLTTGESAVSMPSNELLLLHREKVMCGDTGDDFTSNVPLSFEFDGIFSSDMTQKDVYDELEDVCLGVLDGFNVCIMAHGQKGSGKSHTLFGDTTIRMEGDDMSVVVDNDGLQLQTASQLFSVISHRSDRYQDKVYCTIVEVYDERLCDLIAGTSMGGARGVIVSDEVKTPKKSKSKKGLTEMAAATAAPAASDGSKKLEIKTNFNGETIVQGCLSVEVSSFEEILQLWTECLANRAKRLAEQGLDVDEYESKSHTIATFKVTSMNISTNIGSTGKIQFVDLASSDVVPRRSSSSSKKPTGQEAMLAGVGNSKEWKFANKSLTTMSEVVHARSQFARSVPYRNSTLTHLLSDSLESDTKVVLIACVSSDLDDIQDTACTLRFANKMRKIVIGKATKHTVATRE